MNPVFHNVLGAGFALSLLATPGASVAQALANAAGQPAYSWPAGYVVALTNGSWFDGTRFVRREVVYILEGRITEGPSLTASRTVDLAGRFVIPPIGDGHTHSFDGPFGLPNQRESFLEDGVFYAMTMTAPSTGVVRIRDQLRGPKNVDVASSMGGITGPESHPAEIYEANALGYYTYTEQLKHAAEIRESRRMADDAYFVVESRGDVGKKWPLIRSFAPDFIKVYLRSSERYDERWGKWGPGGGIDPRLLPYIVARARKSGLRTAVAVSGNYDFRQVVRSGAHIATHPPCYQDSSGPGPYHDIDTAEECLIAPADAKLAGQRQVATVAITSEWAKDRPADLVQWEQRNLALLQKAGAPIAIGSNAYGSTPIEGLIAAATKKLYPPEDVLRWATVTTPQMIFPNRRVGCLEYGCEASFLVLDSNPLVNMAALKNIHLRVKDGLPLLPAEYGAKREAPSR